MGFRAGKVKTALGLYNDTQDAESLHTWALLPQALYPTDLRTSLIAHTGGDVPTTRATGNTSTPRIAGFRSITGPVTWKVRTFAGIRR